MAKVFVSHQQHDSGLAAAIATRLENKGLDIYLDVIDNLLSRDGEDLANIIRARMSTCTQLLAVFSNATRRSAWVPWEIGVASEKNFPLATFSTTGTEVPEFLEKWPYLQTIADLDKYAEQSQEFERQILREQRIYPGRTYDSLAKSAAESFHRALRRKLGQ